MTEGVPKVTILLPVFNSARFLRQALDSIFSQTRTDFELLAIENGSTDESLSILRTYTDPRLRIIGHPRNQGLISSLNEGLSAALGQYIARMDADDVMLPERIAEQVAFLDARPEVAVVGALVDFINTEGEFTGVWNTDRATRDEASINSMLPRTNCIAHPAVMIRRAALGDLRYDPRQAGAEDWDLWLRMRSRGLRITKLPKVLLKYRVHPGSIMAGEKQTNPLRTADAPHASAFLWSEWSRGQFCRNAFGRAQSTDPDRRAASSEQCAHSILPRYVSPPHLFAFQASSRTTAAS